MKRNPYLITTVALITTALLVGFFCPRPHPSYVTLTGLILIALSVSFYVAYEIDRWNRDERRQS